MTRKAKQKRLTDTELVILNTAAGRRDRCALPWSKSLKSDVETRDVVAKSLLKRGLLAEEPAPKKSIAWRTDANGGA